MESIIVHKRPKGELTGKEIEEILQIMKSAGLHAEYEYHTGFLPGDRKDFLTLWPKDLDFTTFLNELNAILPREYVAEQSKGWFG